VRYHSHIHLPESERNVKIFYWRCTVNNIFDLVRKNKAILNDWFQSNEFVSYFSRFSSLENELCPDDQVYRYTNNQAKRNKDLENALKLTSIEKKTTGRKS
jgi:hypothetical protein